MNSEADSESAALHEKKRKQAAKGTSAAQPPTTHIEPSAEIPEEEEKEEVFPLSLPRPEFQQTAQYASSVVELPARPLPPASASSNTSIFSERSKIFLRLQYLSTILSIIPYYVEQVGTCGAPVAV